MASDPTPTQRRALRSSGIPAPRATIGYDPSVDRLRGRRVRIPAGTPIYSMHPREPTWRLSERAQTVTVDHCLPGSVGDDDHPSSDPMVRWAGAGGYWRGAHAHLVEEVRT